MKRNAILLIVLAAWITGCARYYPRPLSLERSGEAFDSRSLTNPALREFFITFGYDSQRGWPLREWTQDDFILATFYYQPSLEAARAQWSVSRAGMETAAGRPNPTLTLSPGYDFSAVSPASPWIPGLTIDVPIETAGKRRIRKMEAAFLAEAERLSMASTAALARSNVQMALIDFYAAQSRMKLLNEKQREQAGIYQMLEQRRAVGAISGGELLPVRVALLNLEGERARGESILIDAREHLAGAIGVPRHAIEGMQLAELPEAGKLASKLLLNAQEHRKRALRGRSDLLAMLSRYEASQAALQLEIAKQYPDVRLGSGYQYDQGEDKWNLSIGIDLPILNQNQGPIAEAKARREQVAAQVLEVQAGIISEVDRALALCNSLIGEAAHAREALAALQRERTLTEERFRAGDADQVEVETIRVESITAEMTELDTETRLRSAEVELEATVEMPSPAIIALVARTSDKKK